MANLTPGTVYWGPPKEGTIVRCCFCNRKVTVRQGMAICACNPQASIKLLPPERKDD